MAQILDGKAAAAVIKEQLKNEIYGKLLRDCRAPHLVIITVGSDPASEVYVRNKKKMCQELRIQVTHVLWDENWSEDELISEIREYNASECVDGIMVQLPLPKSFNERRVIDTIDPRKDVDGLTTTNIGRLRSGQACFRPCTAAGIIDLCRHYGIKLAGKNVTVIGRSNIVGKPVADLLLAENATVTQCHSQTDSLKFHTLGTDMVVSAMGQPEKLDETYFCDDIEVIIDVGMNRDKDGKLCGDVDFKKVKELDVSITPVPGGVGPMTVIELMKNTVQAWRDNITAF